MVCLKKPLFFHTVSQLRPRLLAYRLLAHSAATPLRKPCLEKLDPELLLSQLPAKFKNNIISSKSMQRNMIRQADAKRYLVGDVVHVSLVHGWKLEKDGMNSTRSQLFSDS